MTASSKTKPTRKTKATTEPKASAEIHKLLLEGLPHAVILLDVHDTIVFANPAAEQFFGIGHTVLQRTQIADLVTFGCPLLGLVEQVRRTSATVNEYGVEIVLPRSEASQLVDVFGGPLLDDPGLVMLILQQRSMAQMIERQLSNISAARSASGFSAVLAHEIKNPLSGIRGAAQLLEPGLSDEDRALTQLICAETERIRKLIDRIEVFGDERPIARDPVNVHDVLEHVRQLAQSGFARNIDFRQEFDPSLPSVPGDRDLLIQAILNLVKNASEAIQELGGTGGRIIMRTAFRPGVRLSVPGSGTRITLPLSIEIQDNGGGIKPDMLKHIFEPFVTNKINGSGLGLALVAKIVSDHGGVIECDATPRHTTFRLLLPLQRTGNATKEVDHG
ncbi:MAG: two-component system nitrogen regulation sensor histidine kinase GlnL [Hyphomicrobiaceae bacterium]|jgi:two-component system nitrogen regulation sensor histidine kinase GlnL